MKAQLHLVSGRPHENKLVVDGQDITPFVLAEGLSVTLGRQDDPDKTRVYLNLTLAIDELDVTGDLALAIKPFREEPPSGNLEPQIIAQINHSQCTPVQGDGTGKAWCEHGIQVRGLIGGEDALAFLGLGGE